MQESFGKENDYLRLKIGIGRPVSKDPEVVRQYVLAQFMENETRVLTECYEEVLRDLFPEN